MSRRWKLILIAAAALLLGACIFNRAGSADLPIETGLAFTNLSREYYAALGVRAKRGANHAGEFFMTPLLPPGATYRQRFLDVLDEGCPDALDLRLWLYERINADLPIGLDEGEQVGAAPLAAGEIADVPACGTQPLETYTIVNWDAPPGRARVKIAQDTSVEAAIRAAGLFPNDEAVWEFDGVDPALAAAEPPPLAEAQPIAGRVTLADGVGVEGVGVLIRTKYRVRADDDDPGNDPDAGYSDPIAWTSTDQQGHFAFSRPPGAYKIEVFSDDYAFRPAEVVVESPAEIITIIAEPL